MNMAAGFAYDTYKVVRNLRDTGLSEEQAQAISDAVVTAHDVADLATKSDLVVVRSEFQAECAAIRSELHAVEAALRAEIKDIRHDMEKMEARLDHKIDSRFDDLQSQIKDLRKDMAVMGQGIVIKLGSIVVISITLASVILGVLMNILN